MAVFKDKSAAILHDHFPTMGGAERVAIEAARVLNAPIYTTYVSPEVDIPSDVTVITEYQKKYNNPVLSNLIKSGGSIADQARTLSLILDLSNIPSLHEFDIILESNYGSKHYTPATGQKVINYAHSVPQHYYSLYHNTVDRYNYPVFEPIIKLYVKFCRMMDKEANDYIDQFIANSETVQKRIDTYYNRESTIVYPPVTGNWRNKNSKGYFVTWSRLAPRKRIGMIAKAFTHLDERLIIAGEGPESEHIENIAYAHENIEFHGYVNDIEDLVAHAKAVIYAPIDESFGLVGAEALTAGKPLIGVNEGFTQYQVTPETGITFEPDIGSLVDAITKFDENNYNAKKIQQYSKKFSRENFKSSLTREIESAL